MDPGLGTQRAVRILAGDIENCALYSRDFAGRFLEHLHSETGYEFPLPEGSQARTLNEWIVERLARPARGGDVITTDSLRVFVRKVRRQWVAEALLSRDGS